MTCLWGFKMFQLKQRIYDSTSWMCREKRYKERHLSSSMVLIQSESQAGIMVQRCKYLWIYAQRAVTGSHTSQRLDPAPIGSYWKRKNIILQIRTNIKETATRSSTTHGRALHKQFVYLKFCPNKLRNKVEYRENLLYIQSLQGWDYKLSRWVSEHVWTLK